MIIVFNFVCKSENSKTLKHIFLFFLVIFSSNFAFSQDLNLSFETWVNLTGFRNPDKWDTSNETYPIGTYVPVTRETDAQSGTYSVKLKSTYISQVGATLIGVATLGDFEINTSTLKARVSGGEKFTQRPQKLTGFYKYTPIDGDSCGIMVDLFKYNSTKKQRDTIASAIFTSGLNISTWTYFEIPLKYYSTQNPDSLNIIALSSDTSDIKIGSSLWLDNLSFQGTVDYVEENLFSKSIQIFPNPSSYFINLEMEDLKIKDLKIRVFNVDGKVIFENTNNEKIIKIDVSNFAKGIYFMWINSDEKTAIKKFTVE